MAVAACLLAVAGAPVGAEVTGDLETAPRIPSLALPAEGGGSIIVVVATDAPLLPHQRRRLALLAAETMTGRDGITAYALPHDRPEWKTCLRSRSRSKSSEMLFWSVSQRDVSGSWGRSARDRRRCQGRASGR